MARVSIYLNFERSTEEAFNFYKAVFGTDFNGGIARFRDIPPMPGDPEIPEADKNLVMHVELPILGGFMLMGTDAPESMRFRVVKGNNCYIMLQPDTRSETKQLFDALSEGGTIEQPLQEMFWGDYYGSVVDKFGTRWMLNCSTK